jgi:hypothetical protein
MHGDIYREQYLSLSKRGYSPFLNDFLIRLVNSVTGLSYSYADQYHLFVFIIQDGKRDSGLILKRFRLYITC